MKLTAMALMVFALGLPSFADVPWTDVETVTAYLTNMLPAAVSDVRVYASSEAVPLVDRYFALQSSPGSASWYIFSISLIGTLAIGS